MAYNLFCIKSKQKLGVKYHNNYCFNQLCSSQPWNNWLVITKTRNIVPHKMNCGWWLLKKSTQLLDDLFLTCCCRVYDWMKLVNHTQSANDDLRSCASKEYFTNSCGWSKNRDNEHLRRPHHFINLPRGLWKAVFLWSSLKIKVEQVKMKWDATRRSQMEWALNDIESFIYIIVPNAKYYTLNNFLKLYRLGIGLSCISWNQDLAFKYSYARIDGPACLTHHRRAIGASEKRLCDFLEQFCLGW